MKPLIAGDRANDPLVRHFRQIMVWPVQVLPPNGGDAIGRPWEVLEHTEGHPWREVDDEFTGDPRDFQARHYHEFVTFLPHVQRFLYGDELTRSRTGAYGESPMRVFRRHDVARVRAWLGEDPMPCIFHVAHIDLHFFSDLDLAILALEIHADQVPLSRAIDALYSLGRAYPAYWTADGTPGNCARRVEWLSESGDVLAVSDYERQQEYLAYVCEHRAPRLAAHWAFLMQPFASGDDRQATGPRLRQLEYYRMPVLGYLAFDDPRELTRADFVRLTFAGPPGGRDDMPYASAYLRNFERRFCYDRDWTPGSRRQPMRFLCCGHAFAAVGSASCDYFTDAETGVLGQFRHELFLLGLIAHFHKASLLMLSDRLTSAISRLDIEDEHSLTQFRSTIRRTLETFLRFTHRYWFHEVADNARARELFRLWRDHLGSDRLFEEVRDEIQDMNEYLEADSLRRQNNTVVRLTVVTTFGLIGTIVTGFLGMNLIAAADEPLWTKAAYFLAVLVPTAVLTLYTIAKSGRLAELMEILSDERRDLRTRLGALGRLRRERGPVRPSHRSFEALPGLQNR